MLVTAFSLSRLIISRSLGWSSSAIYAVSSGGFSLLKRRRSLTVRLIRPENADRLRENDWSVKRRAKCRLVHESASIANALLQQVAWFCMKLKMYCPRLHKNPELSVFGVDDVDRRMYWIIQNVGRTLKCGFGISTVMRGAFFA